MLSFDELGLTKGTLKVLTKKGFEVPTPIQEITIPAILQGSKDVVAQAQTGTGKTAAFGLPMIELLDEHASNVQALVLTPTRELAIQVAEEIHSLKGKKKLTVIPIYGGQAINQQLRALKKGVDIVIGTPGRVQDHIDRGTLKLAKISFLVLDEADEMLNMGFLDDVRNIMKHTSEHKRTMLFSATMPKEIMQIAREHMREFDEFKVTKGQLTVTQTDQIYFEVSASDKFEALCRIIDIEEEFYGLVFCRTKKDVDIISNHLVERGYDADALHGDISQPQREKILKKFKKRMINVLVATDVAARGIDVHDLSHVINFSLPQDAESYVHRIGRTGRAGKEGNAITFITPEEYRKLRYISRETKTDIRKAKLPGVKDVINTKKTRIKNVLGDIVRSSPRYEYVEMSRELLEASNPEEIIAALLEYSFQDELDEKNYTQIGEALVDTKGKTRLFVTQGKKDGLTSQKLIHFIQNKCGIKSKKIRDIQILDKFSFVTLPFHDAEVLLSYFHGKKKGKGPFITKAKKARENA
ncbi:MAG: DEAD/DEAH box helicase [Thermodesulfobacteriota bacterium]